MEEKISRYDVLSDDGKTVVFVDKGKSSYEPPVCFDRVAGIFYDLTGSSPKPAEPKEKD